MRETSEGRCTRGRRGGTTACDEREWVSAESERKEMRYIQQSQEGDTLDRLRLKGHLCRRFESEAEVEEMAGGRETR